ncbi:aggregation-promoting factor C-terminal-like domain-containing protein [Alloscardovia criceti]|uniref:aggregation-promoting factor C-terminal-like domain-containing protein n=1 Tax=Alloscardovia criceti TaxID=356828 RepID=UPI0003626740|nr:G5 domain-containing protein [Alloscardovia criceti]
MALRWTPQRFVTHRRWRIALCTTLSLALSLSTFFIGERKSVALTVNGDTTYVQTYAISVDGLLQQEGVKTKSHDFIESTSGQRLTNDAHVTVRSAYEATITIDGQQVGFWTYATSADQLLKLFKQNEENAVKVTVDVTNIYNKLTGGFVINADGPVTVIADGKTTTAPDGKLPAASILDSQGITLDQHDRVSVEQDGDNTILRVIRITYSDSTREVEIPYTSRTVEDDTLDEGMTVVEQTGVNGVKTQYLHNTLTDGQVESTEITNEVVTRDPQEEIIRVGTKKAESTQSDSTQSDNSSDNSSDASSDNQQSQNSDDNNSQSSSQDDAAAQQKAQQEAEQQAAAQKAAEEEAARKAAEEAAQQQQQQEQQQSGLWHPTVAQAKAYAQAAAAQYGWTGDNWSALEWLWNRESGWRWNAENASSGAYGIPQSLPGSKMAAYGDNWRDDASIQINWGLNYIRNRYGSPLAAQAHSQQTGWY